MSGYAESFFDVMSADSGVTVTYRRDDTEITGITAILGRSELSAQDTDGVVTTIFSRDFVLKAADIADLGKPQRNDEIDYGGKTYALIEPIYKESDHSGELFRCFGKEITD